MTLDRLLAAAAIIALSLGTSCGTQKDDTSSGTDSTDSNDSSDTGDTNDSGDSGTGDYLCTDPVEPACTDDMILDLSLHDDAVTNGDVTTTTDGADFLTVVDASAGGSSQAADHPWVYFRFDDDGASRVDIDDETALESMDWHISARRFEVRLNGGDGGPSCVGADRVRNQDYAEIKAIPDNTEYALEDFYDDDCALKMGAFGMGPDFTLDSWWGYNMDNGGCLTTSLNPFVIQLDDGRVIKLVIEAYYESGQEECNAKGVPGDNSGILTFRWQFLPAAE
jgi:hypothetical protein